MPLAWVPAMSYSTFSIEIPFGDEGKMKKFQVIVDEYHENLDQYIGKLAEELRVSEFTARCITYFRGRIRWTQMLEDRLIKADRAGKPCPCVMMGEENEWLDANGF